MAKKYDDHDDWVNRILDKLETDKAFVEAEKKRRKREGKRLIDKAYTELKKLKIPEPERILPELLSLKELGFTKDECRKLVNGYLKETNK